MSNLDDDKIQRVLEVFSNETKELIAEYKLVGFELSKFRAWFREDGSDPLMYYCYTIEDKDVAFLSAYLPEPVSFKFDKYAYFVAAYMETEDWLAKYAKR